MSAVHALAVPDRWAHQPRAIQSLRDALRRGQKRVMLQLPTGAGKTVVASTIIKSALEKGKRVIFTVPALSLIDQTVDSFSKAGISDVGVIQANHPMTDHNKAVQICSIQSLMNRDIPRADLVIIDEAHRIFHFITDWMGREDWAHVPFIGLSATPWSKGLGRLYDGLIIGASMGELMEAGTLCDYQAKAPYVPDLSGVKTQTNAYGETDYVESGIGRVMDQKALVANVVETWLEKAERRPTLVFAVNRAHAGHLADEFERHGVHCGYMDANTPALERKEIERRFHDGRIEVVCNVGCLTTGTDWDVRCIVLARPMKSEILYVQILGRGLRNPPGKDHLLVLDHSGTMLTLGPPEMIHYDKLNQGNLDLEQDKKAKSDTGSTTPKARLCAACQTVMPWQLQVCPSCGARATRAHEVETISGLLVDFDRSNKAKKAKARKTNKLESWDDKIAFIASLRAFAVEKGKTDKWVSAMYRTRLGVWPNDPRVKYAKAAPIVGADVRRWIVSRQIAYAKSKSAEKGVSHAA